VWYVRHPGGPRGRQIGAYVQSHDLMPTALDLLGIPFACEGQSVWPLVTGQATSLRDHIVCGWAGFTNGPAGGTATVRDGKWRYTVMANDPGKLEELYDLAGDPEEERNVVAEHPDVVALQRSRIETVIGGPLPAQFIEVCDPAPSPMAQFIGARSRNV